MNGKTQSEPYEARPDERSEEADTRCYRHVNQLGITPGGWESRNSGNGYLFVETINHDDGSDTVCKMNKQWLHDERVMANLNLIMAAPDMYEALVEITKHLPKLSSFPKTPTEHGRATKMVYDAINKAAGKVVD